MLRCDVFFSQIEHALITFHRKPTRGIFRDRDWRECLALLTVLYPSFCCLVLPRKDIAYVLTFTVSYPISTSRHQRIFRPYTWVNFARLLMLLFCVKVARRSLKVYST
ncbi:hypothetical protein D915_011103 [Fasciola hepatica]|uniref:Uncharacterized protein n=1 Tax=Fasciola hepatica TaxID=6192 RepID=A0A4E0QXW0_FASHE|nr:hypothetical protein D915_011103 [Fasciola hepatica]